MLVQEFLEKTTRKTPDKIALVSDFNRLNYKTLNMMSNRISNALIDHGIQRGDRVVVLLDNSTEAVVSIFGILKAGAVFVLINPTMKSKKLSYILNNCRASAFITHKNKHKSTLEAIVKTPSLKVIIFAGNGKIQTCSKTPNCEWNTIMDEYPSTRPNIRMIDIDLASLIYTSGTTGSPKGVMLTHLNMTSASTSITTYLENRQDDIILNVLPLSFDYGLYQIIMSTQFGGTVVLKKAFIYTYDIINTIKKEKITGFPIVPTISATLLQLKNLKNENFRDLRYITNTAAALPASHIQDLQSIFSETTIYSMYGLTECKRVSYLPPEELNKRPTSVGKAIPNVETYLVDEKNNIITEPYITGELVVRGANIMKGYWELPTETEKMLRQGQNPWEKVLYTNDLFKMDDEGFLYFVSRKDNIIKSRGEKVSPKEIENVLYMFPDILEVTVIGVPDEIIGEAIKAYIVLKDLSELSKKEIIAHARKHLENFMIPQHIEFRDSLPKTSTGKMTTHGL